MLSDAMLQKKFQISKDDATWGFAFKQLAIQNNIKIDDIECYDAFQCSLNIPVVKTSGTAQWFRRRQKWNKDQYLLNGITGSSVGTPYLCQSQGNVHR